MESLSFQESMAKLQRAIDRTLAGAPREPASANQTAGGDETTSNSSSAPKSPEAEAKPRK